VQSRLVTVRDQVGPTVASYRAAVDAFADRLAAGHIPDSVPVPGGAAVDPGAVLDAIFDRLGPGVDPRAREQIRAAVLSGDERAALVSAATDLIADQGTEAVAELRASLEDRRELDVITELADRAGRSRNAIVGQLNTVRDAARWLRPPTAVAGAVVMAGAAAGIAWTNRRAPRRAGYLLAAAAIACSSCTWHSPISWPASSRSPAGITAAQPAISAVSLGVAVGAVGVASGLVRTVPRGLLPGVVADRVTIESLVEDYRPINGAISSDDVLVASRPLALGSAAMGGKAIAPTAPAPFVDDVAERRLATATILDPETRAAERNRELRRYDVDWLVLTPNDADRLRHAGAFSDGSLVAEGQTEALVIVGVRGP
jgi:hypothetical protein